MFSYLPTIAASDVENLKRDKQIVAEFYVYLKTVEAIETPEDLNRQWKEYVKRFNQADQSRAQKLAYITTHSQQILKQEFTYFDLIKAGLLLSIPDFLLVKHGFSGTRGARPDEVFGAIKYAPSNHDYLLTAGLTSDIKNFEHFVLQNQVRRNAAHEFEQMYHYLSSQAKLDKYTMAHFSQMMLEQVMRLLRKCFEDEKILIALMVSGLDMTECVDDLQQIYKYLLSVYVLEKKKLSVSTTNYFQELHITRHLSFEEFSCKNIKFNLQENIIEQYKRYVQWNISLRLAPAITDQEKRQQKQIYQVDTQAREAMSSQDQVNGRLLLGLEDHESYERFICDDYVFSDEIFLSIKSLNAINPVFIINFLMLSSIDFLLQVKREKCQAEIYNIVTQRLWRAFVDDERFSQHLRSLKNYSVVIPRLKNTQNSIVYFENFLRNSSAISANISLVCALSKQESQLLKELVQYIINRSSHPYLKIVVRIFDGHFLSFKHRINSAARIAKLLLSFLEPSNKNAVEICQSLICIERMIKENNMAVLINRYEQLKNIKLTVNKSLLKVQIAGLCNQDQLIKLKNCLEQFVVVPRGFRLFASIHPIKNIIFMIDKKKHPVQILLALKNIKFLANQYEILKTRIASFFSADVDGEKTMDSLISSISGRSQDSHDVAVLHQAINLDARSRSNFSS